MGYQRILRQANGTIKGLPMLPCSFLLGYFNMSSRKTSECTECNKIFYNEWTLKRHYNEKHSGFRFVRCCPSKGCTKTFHRKYFLVQHLCRSHGFSNTEAKLKARTVNATFVPEADRQKTNYNVIKVEDYSDISDDDFNPEEVTGHKSQQIYQNVPTFNFDSMFDEPQPSPLAMTSPISSPENFSMSSCELPEEISDTELSELDKTLGTISSEFNPCKAVAVMPTVRQQDPEIIVISDDEEENSSTDHENTRTVKETNTMSVTLTLIRKDIKYSDGTSETNRDSVISYSEGINPEEIDFKQLAVNIISEIPRHFDHQNRRYASADNL